MVKISIKNNSNVKSNASLSKCVSLHEFSAVGAGDAAASPRKFWGAKFEYDLGKFD